MRDEGRAISYGKDVMVMEEQYVGIRYNATGVFGYSFRKGGTEVFRASCPVLPKPDILLSGFGEALWHRNYDRRITLCPGARRDVTDESGSVRGYYEIVELGEFVIVTESARARVRASEAGWQIFAGGDLTAELLRLPENERVRFTENGFDMEKRFRVNILRQTGASIYPYIMAIPLLGF